MRLDKKEYYAKLLKQNEEKVKFLQEKFEIEKKFKEKKILEIQKHNELLEERNKILEKYLKLKVSLPTGIF